MKWIILMLRIREGNGTPLQCSCLENPRDGRAWWAAVCGVVQIRTWLKWLSSSSSSSSFRINMQNWPHRFLPHSLIPGLAWGVGPLVDHLSDCFVPALPQLHTLHLPSVCPRVPIASSEGKVICYRPVFIRTGDGNSLCVSICAQGPVVG